MRKLLKRSSNTWTYGMSSANRLRAPTARRLKPLLSMINPQRPARMITSSMPIIRLKPTFKKSGSRHTGELCPNLPNCTIASQKIKVDNKARFRYQVGYWFRLIDSSICCAAADAGTQFVMLDSSAQKKQLLICLYLHNFSLCGMN